MNRNGNIHTDHKEKVANKRTMTIKSQAKYQDMERGKRDPIVEEIFRRPAYGKIGGRISE